MKPQPIPIVIVSAVLTVATAWVLPGQSTTPLRFEVAAVKPSAEEVPGSNTAPGPRPMSGGVRTFPGGRLTTQATVLRSIIQYAYRLKPYQVLGGPDWINSARYDIEAKAENNAPPEQLLVMLQALLEDKFNLKVHPETKQLTVYELVAAKGGLKLQPPREGGCITPDLSKPGQGMPPPQPGQPRPTPCGSVAMSAMNNGAQLNGGQVFMRSLIFTLSNMLGRTVIDKTGFTDTFDVHMSFTPDSSLEGLPPIPGRGGAPIALAEDPSNGTLFTEIQRQLGLKLESAKGPVEVIVIDRVERPPVN